MSRRRADFWCALLLILVATLLFSDVLFLGNNFYFRDLFQYHFPLKRIVRDTIARGEFPWWERLIAGGQPMAANPAYEVFYPPQWLIFVGPFAFGFALHIVVHVYIALLGMYAFLRALMMRVEAALFGALSFGLSGFLLGTLTNLPTFFVWSWTGVVGWALLRAIRTGRIGAAAFAVAMPLLVGEPMAVAQMLFMIAVGAAWTVWERPPSAALRRSAPLVAALLLAAGIAAVQIVPAIDHARESSRSRGFRYDVVTDFSMPPVRPFELLNPRIFGLITPEAHAYWGFRLFQRKEPYLLSLYCGMAVVVLALTGLVLRRRGWTVTLLLAAISYVLAIGDATPIFRWMWDAGLRSIRYPEKFAAMGLIALIIFAASVAEELLRGDRAVRRIAIAIACGIALLLGISGAVWTPAASMSFFRIPPQVTPVAALLPRTFFLSAAIAALWAVVIWHAGTLRVWMFAAFALLLFDVGSFGNAAVPRMPRAFFTPPPVARAVRGAIFDRGEWTQLPIASRYSAVSTGWTARNAMRPYSAAAWGIPSVLEADFDETDLLPTHDLLNAMMRLGNAGNPRWSGTFATIANAGTFLDYRPFDEGMRAADGDPSKMDPVTAHPAAGNGAYYFPRTLLPLGDVATANPAAAAFVPFRPFAPAAARVIAVREDSNSAAIDVESQGEAFLVATVTRQKYWQATIDGHPATLLPANFAFQGIIVPTGRHRIEMRYRNPLLFWGAAISVLAMIIALIPRRPRPRSGS